MTFEEIKALANRQRNFTKKIKEQLTDEAKKYNMIIPECGCKNRWHDLAVQLYVLFKDNQDKQNIVAPVSSTTNYRYKKISPIRLAGVIYDKNTPKEVVESLRKSRPLVFNQIYDIL